MKKKNYVLIKLIALTCTLLIPMKRAFATGVTEYFDSKSQCRNISINLGQPFTVSSNQVWCYVTEVSNGYFKASVSNNGEELASQERTAIIALSSAGMPDSLITIVQAGIAPVIVAKEPTIFLTPDDLEFRLTITSNTEIEFVLPGWISEKPGNTWTKGTKSYAFTVSSGMASQANIIVKAKDPVFNKQISVPIIKQASMNLIAMQYNVRVQTTNDGDNNWPNRKSTAAQFIVAKNADVVGTQEMSKTLLGVDQYNDLKNLLSANYNSYVGYRDESSVSDEGNAIFYKKNRFTLVSSGKFWLSDTPNTKSKGWDASYNRIAVWVILKDNSTQKELFVINTHFDNTGSTARANSATLINSKIAELSGGRPVILTGDLNTNPSTAPINTLKTILDHTKDIALTTSGPAYTLHDYGVPTSNVFFDYVFTSKGIGKINSHEVAGPKYNNVYLSDHCPVVANMDIYYNP